MSQPKAYKCNTCGELKLLEKPVAMLAQMRPWITNVHVHDGEDPHDFCCPECAIAFLDEMKKYIVCVNHDCHQMQAGKCIIDDYSCNLRKLPKKSTSLGEGFPTLESPGTPQPKDFLRSKKE